MSMNEGLTDNSKNAHCTSQRNYSLDLLRVISVIMIICLHVGSHGGIDEFYNYNSFNGFFLKLSNTLCFVAVNVFVLISGYFLVNSKFKVSKLIKLLLVCFFYSISLFLVSIICGYSSSLGDYLICFLPVSYNNYWFITAYVGMYCLFPFMNKLINHMSKKEHLVLVVVFVFIYSLLRDILIDSEPFLVNHGYSLVWFIVLYFIAAYIKKYINAKTNLYLLLYFAFALAAFFLWVLFSFLSDKSSFISVHNISDYWIRYNSFLILSASVCLFLFFTKVKIQGGIIARIVSFISSLSLGIYLLHDNRYVRDYLWKNLLHTDKFTDNAWLVPKVIVVVLFVFVCCAIIDALRKVIFDFIYSRRWCKSLFNQIDNLPQSIMNRIK